MADFGMWGPAESGDRLARQDMQQQQLNDLTITETKQKIQENQGKILDQQQARVQANQQQELVKQQQAQQIDILQKNQNESLYSIGETMMKQGLVVQGAAYLKAASDSSEKMALADKNKATAELEKTKKWVTEIGHFSNMIDNTHSQEDYDKSINLYESVNGTKLPDSIKSIRWSPEVKEKLQALGSTQLEKQKMLLADQEAKIKQADEASKEKLRNAQILKTTAETKSAQSLATRRTKESGKEAVTALTPKADITSAMSLIRQDNPGAYADDSHDPTLQNAATFIASHAQTLIRQNKGMDRSDALQQAFQQAKSDGLIEKNTQKTGEHSLFGMKFGGDVKPGISFNAAKAQKSDKPAVPTVGVVKQGYRFNGGDPADKNNWEKV